MVAQWNAYPATPWLPSTRSVESWIPNWVPTQERETKSEGQVWAMDSDPSLGRIYSGGNSTAISGEVHQGFAQFSDSSGLATMP